MSDATICLLCETQPKVTGKQDGEWVVGATAYCDCTTVTAYQENKTLKVPSSTAENAIEKWHTAVRMKSADTRTQSLFEEFDLEPV
jgi:hypothetical protein